MAYDKEKKAQRDRERYVIKRKEFLMYRQQYYKTNRLVIREKSSKKRATPEEKEKIALQCKRYVETHREYVNKRRKMWLDTRPHFKLRTNLARRIHSVLKGNNKSKNSLALLGCSTKEYKAYLESKFKPGMSWNNYNKHGWHVDHIIPCVSFDLTKPEEQAKCFHYSNTQPLWANENYSKGGKTYSDTNCPKPQL